MNISHSSPRSEWQLLPTGLIWCHCNCRWGRYLCGRFWAANPHLGMRGPYGHLGDGGSYKYWWWLRRVEVCGWLVVAGCGQLCRGMRGVRRRQLLTSQGRPRPSSNQPLLCLASVYNNRLAQDKHTSVFHVCDEIDIRQGSTYLDY